VRFGVCAGLARRRPPVRGGIFDCRISYGLHLEDGRAGGERSRECDLGAYLNQIGLSEEAILYITHAAPTSVQWMSLEEAAEYGIAVAKLPPTGVSPDASDAVGKDRPQGSPGIRKEARSSAPSILCTRCLSGGLDRMLSFCRSWIGSTRKRFSITANRRPGSRLAQQASVCQPLDSAQLCHTAGSLSATCAAAGGTCRVKGTMSWKLHETKTTTASHGVATFAYSIVLKDSGPQISAERTP